MKKYYLAVIILILCLTCFCSYAYGADTINVLYHGKPIEFDAQPYFLNDRIMVPIRAIFESLGASVEWDDSSNTATAYMGDRVVVLSLGNTHMLTSGAVVNMDVPVEMHSDRIYASARYVAQAFDKRISYHGPSQTAIISDANEYAFYENISKPVPTFDWVANSAFVSEKTAFNGSMAYTYTCDENGLSDYFNYLQLDFGYMVYNMEYLENAVRHTYVSDGLRVSVTEGMDSSKLCSIEVIPDVDMVYTISTPQISAETEPEKAPSDLGDVDYGQITGSELIEAYTRDGMDCYVYEYSPFEVSMYEAFIESKGWVFVDFSMDIDTFSNIKYWKKGDTLLCITTNPFYNIVIVAIA